MTSRHMIAYGLIAGLAAAGLLALWFGVLRERWALRRHRDRLRQDRQDRRDRRDAESGPSDLPVSKTP